MAFSREILQDLVDTYGGGDYNNIEYIMTTNTDIIRLDWFRKDGAGVNWVDKDLGGGIYRTGVEIYNTLPNTVQNGLNENDKHIIFFEVECFDRIGMKATAPPAWAFQAPSKNAYLASITVDGNAIKGFGKTITFFEITLPAGTTVVPTIAGVEEDAGATVSVTQATVLPGNAEIVVTAADGVTKKTYLVRLVVGQ